MGIREAMPLLARHEGVWDGIYIHYNQAGEKIDEHTSRLLCRVDEDSAHPYHQTNFYTWADGRTETRDFPADFRDGRIWWDNELIVGWAAEVALDEKKRTLMLYWQRTGDPDLYLYEMIQLSDAGDYRCRTWHWIRGGEIASRTSIEERLVSRDWRGIEAAMETKAA
ncbi:DUF3598 domain-containing protein [Sphingomonas radiodurans]|uniref:DUF3598 domain-containing protein n=1 Tax=Sphingomonas radiodurans TaxID=2890321 RepID=UPI001E5847CA|nr:DUF3598 domain-containing protein [Sphingomonas radiodurans]WBH18025.1 DUF3598 domain-containing protein [Sphingomonas radiodurans]